MKEESELCYQDNFKFIKQFSNETRFTGRENSKPLLRKIKYLTLIIILKLQLIFQNQFAP